MSDAVQPIRIAIIVDRDEASCLPLALPFSVIGYPMIKVDFFKAGGPPPAGFPAPPWPEMHPEAVALGVFTEQAKTVQPLADLQPEAYDLVLDWQNWTVKLPGLPPGGWRNLITGPGSPLLEKVLCQFQELREKHEINAGILLQATDAIVTINEDHRIIGYNYGAEKIFRYPRAEALGQDLKILIPPPYKEEHREYVRRYVATRQAHVIGKHLRLTALRRDGGEFPISISFSVAEIGGNLYFTGIIRDITEYQEMEHRLLQSERLAAVGNTVTHIAHEIKNPLMVIGGFARQLLKADALDDKARQKLSIIGEEVARLEGMVAEMREFVRRPAAQRFPGKIAALVDEVIEMFRDTLAEHHITVRRVEDGPLPDISFDPNQLRQVFLNLLKNAMEAMPQGGEITVASRIRGANVEIAVTDTGQGMAPEVVSNIFQPYFSTKEKGTGLGLAICQSIVQEHGGFLLADSTPGQGSTFTIQLPLEEKATA